MTKRARTLSEIAEDYIDALRKIHDDPRCDDGSKMHLRTLAHNLGGMALIVDTVLRDYAVEAKRKMGRHARSDEQQEQWRFDMDCYTTTEILHHEGHNWTAAVEAAAQEIHAAPETVRKARSRVKKQLESKVK